ncbi:MAG: hypothetical protein RIG77_14255, partial [Cyclobacteriaceae bacterium]
PLARIWFLWIRAKGSHQRNPFIINTFVNNVIGSVARQSFCLMLSVHFDEIASNPTDDVIL